MKKKETKTPKTKSLTPLKKETKELTKKDSITKAITTKKKEPKEITVKKKETKALVVKKKNIKNTTTKKSVSTTKKTTEEKSTTSDIKKKKITGTMKKVTTAKAIAIANEYFDLPYRYNETIVTLLAQTPKRIFVYWDISDKDKENYMKLYGEDFLSKTIPFLRIKNETQNYTFDVDINDFANCWYININDPNCKYSVELYRRFISTSNNTTSNKDTQYFQQYIFIATSNKMDVPNNKIISTSYPRIIEFRNIKTNMISYKKIEAPRPINKFFDLFFKESHEKIDVTNNPSSR